MKQGHNYGQTFVEIQYFEISSTSKLKYLARSSQLTASASYYEFFLKKTTSISEFLMSCVPHPLFLGPGLA